MVVMTGSHFPSSHINVRLQMGEGPSSKLHNGAVGGRCAALPGVCRGPVGGVQGHRGGR